MSNLQLFDHEFNGYKIRQRSEDDYVNITDIAKANGKDVHEFLRLPSTVKFIDALADRINRENPGFKINRENLVVSKRGRNGGTYAHPLIGMKCAQWASVECEIWANNTLVRHVENDPTLTQELLAQHDDRTAAQVISDRVETMEEADSIKQVVQTGIKRLSWIEGVDYALIPSPRPREMARLENLAGRLGLPSGNMQPVRIKTRAGMAAVIEYARTELGMESLTQTQIDALAASGVVNVC